MNISVKTLTRCEHSTQLLITSYVTKPETNSDTQLYVLLTKTNMHAVPVCMYGMSASNIHKLLLLVWFCLLFAVFCKWATELPPLASCSLPNTVQNRNTYLQDLGNLSAILSLQSPLTTPAITSSLFFNPATTPSTIYAYCPSLYSFKLHLVSPDNAAH